MPGWGESGLVADVVIGGYRGRGEIGLGGTDADVDTGGIGTLTGGVGVLTGGDVGVEVDPSVGGAVGDPHAGMAGSTNGVPFRLPLVAPLL